MWWDRITRGYKISQIKTRKTEMKKTGPFPEVKSFTWLVILSEWDMFLKTFSIGDNGTRQQCLAQSIEVAS